MATKPQKKRAMVVRVPEPVARQLEKAAARAKRSRNAELLLRLEQSLALERSGG